MAFALLAACSSGQHAEDARAKPVVTPPPPTPLVVAVDAAVTKTGVGDAAVHIIWKDVPLDDRKSPGATPCKTARLPSVQPTTTWGVPDAFVILDGAPSGDARLVLADCALSPRAAVATSLVVTSHALQPAQLVVRERGTPDALAAGTAQALQLPIAGHAVSIPLTAGRAYELAAGDETAWVLAAHALVTDATGTATWRDLASGPHALTAWLPPRAGRPGKLAHGTVTVEAGGLADATIELK